MAQPVVNEATQILTTLTAGDRSSAGKRLFQLVYNDLRDLAAKYMHGQPANHTLQPTALVHEAYLRLIDQTRANYQDRTHFFATAARAMRQILIDHAKGRNASKRGGSNIKVPLQPDHAAVVSIDDDLVALDEALAKLEVADERKCRVVEMRFFGGMTIDETANALGVSTTTVENDWDFARAWLASAMKD